MDFKDMDISPELREKAKACTTPEELMALAKSEGYKLTEQDLEAVSGGGWNSCGSNSENDNCGKAFSYSHGDTRSDIDPQAMSAAFVEGRVRA